MAELDTSGSKNNKKGRTKKPVPRIDLTAMVDLGFLLVTFFVMTTTLSSPKAMDLFMPDKDDHNKDQLAVKASTSMTILLGSNNKIEWYMGEAGKSRPTIEGYGPKELRHTLIEKSKEVKRNTGKDMIVLIKPSDKSIYKNMVAALDEISITNIQSYAIIDITVPEINLLKQDGLY